MVSFIFIVIIFFICMSISSVMNVLLKTTGKRDWFLSFVLSLAIALFASGVL
ncbi:hypothetical protein QRD89_06395 [Halobacillus sp. ACCC02827]|uniref:hypothetical protein n=1 Tax=Bacillaceae TaxID=186817 RepID=UPI000427AE8B|nr:MULTISPECIES: hypothetical protein [Bacillaceae]QHT46158.1 hypothetical protein M662_06520 [Bacillus sp. SB49]WJE16972.1 hypothetical protein QRD89_06395 [Halobacillus sp. ACCC02827]